MVDIMKVRRNKVPNKKDTKIINAFWGSTLQPNPEIRNDVAFRMENKRCIVLAAKLSHDECIERNKKYFENLKNK